MKAYFKKFVVLSEKEYNQLSSVLYHYECVDLGTLPEDRREMRKEMKLMTKLRAVFGVREPGT